MDNATAQILIAGGGAGLFLIAFGSLLRYAFREPDKHHGEHRRRGEEVRILTDSGEFRLLHGRHREMDHDGPTTVMPRGFAIRAAPVSDWEVDKAMFIREHFSRGHVTARQEDSLRFPLTGE